MFFVLQNDRAYHPKDQRVLLPGSMQVVDPKLERRESPFVKSDDLIVQPDFRQVVHCIELQANRYVRSSYLGP